jgi:hypothetical protein
VQTKSGTHRIQIPSKYPVLRLLWLDAQRFAAGLSSGEVLVFDLSKKEKLVFSEKISGLITDARLSSAGYLAISSNLGELMIVDMKAKARIPVLGTPELLPIYQLRWSANGQTLGYISYKKDSGDTSALLWSAQLSKPCDYALARAWK